MCGITGIVDFQGRRVAGETIERMNAAQATRGPDDWGAVLIDLDGAPGRTRDWGPGIPRPAQSARIGLGNVRLSILDLSPAGHQPMTALDGAVWLVYNGEVYNYLELRDELLHLGCPITSGCDTEVVLWALLTWGPAALDRFNGMWGLALWDQRRRELLCARDRFGVKPFYYAEQGGRFVFASEPGAVFEAGDVRRAADAHEVSRFLAHGRLPAPHATFFAGMSQLPPGSLLRITPDGRVGHERWWRPRPRPLPTLEDHVEAVRELVVDAVRLRLRSDVPVGACLSGGLDSSSIVAVLGHDLAGASHGPPRAFTARFTDAGLDELDYARLVAAHSGAELDVIEPQSDWLAAGDLLDLVRKQGEPFPSLSVFAQYCVFRRMRRCGVVVALDGQGADELFWGYPWHGALAAADGLRRRDLRQTLQAARSSLGMDGVRGLWSGVAGLAFYNAPRLRTLRDVLWRTGGSGQERWDLARRGLLGATPPLDLHQARLAEIEQEPLPSLLRYEDRNSMAFSVETRLPFLDYRLVEQVLSCPEPDLLTRGWSKYLLRQAMRGIIPERIRWRRTKLGFAAPTERLLGDVPELVRDAFDANARSLAVIDRRRVLARLDRGGALPAWVWRAASVELWLRAFELQVQ